MRHSKVNRINISRTHSRKYSGFATYLQWSSDRAPSLCCFIINTLEPMGCGICIGWPALPSSYANRHWHFPHTAHPLWPLCSGPENHQTLATLKSLKRCNNLPWDITIVELQLSICHNVDQISLKLFCCRLEGLTVQYSLYMRGCSTHLLPIYHSCPLFSRLPFIHQSIHLSSRQFI